MIGIIPSANTTYEVEGDFNSSNLHEGKLYVDPSSNQLYYYSIIETRSNPKTGYFPVWNGKQTFVSNFSKVKYLSDVIKSDLENMSSNIDMNVARQIQLNMKKALSTGPLNPAIADGDNTFTQCIKGAICALKLSMTDLIDMTASKYNPVIIQNYYSALNKISFMRTDRWYIWLDMLNISFDVTVFKDDKRLVYYRYPSNEFDTGIVKYDNIVKSKMDPFKKIIKILMVMNNINKNNLRSEEVDDYTINNLITTINGSKALSAQIFSRFIRMADLDYTVNIYDCKNQIIFTYRDV